MSAPPALPRLLLLTDRAQLPLGRSLVAAVAEGVEAGLTHVVLRELDLGDEQRVALAQALVGVGATVIAAHRPLPGTIGTHLPATAEGAGLGRSCHSRAEVVAAAEEGTAYATLGPVGPSASKPGYGPPLPLGDLAGLPIPAFALGGVTPANAGAMLAAGAHGVAVMGVVMRAESPAAVVARLLAVTR